MNEQEKKLIRQLGMGTLKEESFFKKFPVPKSMCCKYIFQNLNIASQNQDLEAVSYSIILYFHCECRPIESQLDFLCKLLKEEWHNVHEDIIEILSDSNAIEWAECLIHAVTKMDLAYMADKRPLVEKVGYALSKMEHPTSAIGLKKLASSNDEMISEVGRLHLKRLGIE